MAEECKYYYYDCGYCCLLKREKEGNSSIDSDTVHKYCWGYQYEGCPRYKAQDSSGGCFLTSACVEAKGLPDDCRELTVLRRFRDEYLHTLPEGEAEIAEYYDVAPKIVTTIEGREDSLAIFLDIYDNLVIPCVKHIENGRNNEAHKHYRDLVQQLKLRYLN
ncbi:MAG: hypothetical protein IJ364_04850 [Oscillospiraceae bacterium]|nr:hypothetical protein [Oscillospiraceae bacterium]